MHIYIYVTVCIVFYPETPFILLLVDPVDLSSGSHRGPVLFSAAVVGACRAASATSSSTLRGSSPPTIAIVATTTSISSARKSLSTGSSLVTSQFVLIAYLFPFVLLHDEPCFPGFTSEQKGMSALSRCDSKGIPSN